MSLRKNKISEKIEKGEEVELDLENENLIQQLSETVEILLDKTQWFKNIRIENKDQELERFKQYRKENQDYQPEFSFKPYRYNQEQLEKLVNSCRKEAKKIEKRHLEKYGAKTITPDDMREFFTEIFDETELYINLASEIKDEEKWREYSEEIWPMTDSETAEKSIKYLESRENQKTRKQLQPQELAEMFRKEIERLGMDYKVETRRTAGCFNSPEEKTVVVAEGEDGERKYSKEETEMLTMHEIFHSVRAYNGFKAGESSGFPEILGLHTPFYDRAEEGGALYREKKTGTMYSSKEFDYHLRLVAAYRLSNSDNFRKDFMGIAEKLIDLGATEERAFQLLARNREALRHHIYLGGYHDWREIEDKEKMLIGKVNQKWAEKLWKEAEANGMIKKPEIGSEKLFDFTFKDSE